MRFIIISAPRDKELGEADCAVDNVIQIELSVKIKLVMAQLENGPQQFAKFNRLSPSLSCY